MEKLTVIGKCGLGLVSFLLFLARASGCQASQESLCSTGQLQMTFLPESPWEKSHLMPQWALPLNQVSGPEQGLTGCWMVATTSNVTERSRRKQESLGWVGEGGWRKEPKTSVAELSGRASTMGPTRRNGKAPFRVKNQKAFGFIFP